MAPDRERMSFLIPSRTVFFKELASRASRMPGYVGQQVEFYQELSQVVLARLWADARIFDAVYIDGDHKFDGVFCDAYYAHRLLKPGGILVIDDVWMDAVFLACHFMEESYRYENIGELRKSYSSAGDDQRIDDTSLLRQGQESPEHPRVSEAADRDCRGRQFQLAVRTHRRRGTLEDAARRRVSDLSREALVEPEGNTQNARKLLLRALRFQPTRVKTYLRLSRTFYPRPGQSSGRKNASDG